MLKEDWLWMTPVPILESCQCRNEPMVSTKAENLQTEWKTSNLNHGATYSGCLFDHLLFWRTSSRCWQWPLLSLLLIVLLHHNGGKLPQLWHSISIPICFWQLPGRLLVNIKVHVQYIQYGTEINMLNNTICKGDNCLITMSSEYYLDFDRGTGSRQGQVAGSCE
jgi:hypothetical protein